PAFYALTPDETTYEMLGVSIGTGLLTTTHTADLYASDFEGVYRLFAANEAVWSGGRYVVQYCNESDDPANWDTQTNVTVVGSKTDPLGGTTAVEVTATSAIAIIRNSNSNAMDGLNTVRLVSIWIRRITGTGPVAVFQGTQNVNHRTDITAELTGAWQRFAADKSTLSNHPNPYCGVQIDTSGDVVEIAFGQVEAVSGRSDEDTPSEYINNPSAVQAFTVTKVYANENGNTVASNVVTEAV
ncbi:unnamed protein product, partial [marine sediment metagenome]